MFYRLRTDFRLSIITLLGACAILGVAPFAVFRFMQGEVLAGLADSVIVLCVCVSVLHAWLTGRTERSGLFMAVTTSLSAVVITRIVGEPGLLWLFPCLVTSFFLTGPRVATVVNLAAILALAVQTEIFASGVHLWSFIATSLVVSACAYVFAFRNQSQRERLEHLATIDPLTGVANRRSMDQELDRAVANAERSRTPCAIALLDIDHFKRINDEYGHSAGDEVLVDLVALIEQHTRRTDQLFRYGGEEFVLLLPGTEGAGLETVLANLQFLLRKHLKLRDNAITVSFGVAQFQPGESVDGWLERADAALYEAKASGRDRIIFADLGQGQSGTTASPAAYSLT
ncbi:GGDEF domain-containing protein [Marinobacter qingdaonensis]|uniref:diguanylate cyclase n=1 Tax=Marinobacter qingdaonensis TaxID=3108486 RepID=A0ABU5NW18_9GAMM|nr:GGDEF domain-containing protein [Marinobacter sp. ASW11-75]MEA1080013.1 GGDEF domain-containing protein [Marinobacter sp. ASW11-75]